MVLPVELLGEHGGGVSHVAAVFELGDVDDVLVDVGAAAVVVREPDDDGFANVGWETPKPASEFEYNTDGGICHANRDNSRRAGSPA